MAYHTLQQEHIGVKMVTKRCDMYSMSKRQVVLLKYDMIRDASVTLTSVSRVNLLLNVVCMYIFTTLLTDMTADECPLKVTLVTVCVLKKCTHTHKPEIQP